MNNILMKFVLNANDENNSREDENEGDLYGKKKVYCKRQPRMCLVEFWALYGQPT